MSGKYHVTVDLDDEDTDKLRDALKSLIGKTITGFELIGHSQSDDWDGDYEHYESYREQLVITASDGTVVNVWSQDSEDYASSLKSTDPMLRGEE